MGITYRDIKQLADKLENEGFHLDKCKREFLEKICNDIDVDHRHLNDYVLIVPKKYVNDINIPEWIVLTEYTDDVILFNSSKTLRRN